MEPKKNCLLVIEDDELNREVLKSVFEDDYDILEAENGLKGIEILEQNSDRICAVLLDLMMPVMDGISFLKNIAETGIQSEIPVFVITGDQSTPSIAEAYRLGVMDVIAKPVVPYVITRRVNSVIELYTARKQLSSEVQEQRNRMVEQQKQIIDLNDGMIEALFTAEEFRSGETGSHVRNIRKITEIMLTETDLGKGLTPSEISCISRAAMMHDIGKISIPDAILNKPGRLTDDERKIMQTHTTLGLEIINKIPQFRKHEIYDYACDIILHHHEKWDGKGYPEGLAGNEISVCAQVVSIADVYEALLSKRVYKDPYSRDETVKMIVDGKCGVFGPELLEQFLKVEPIIFREIFPGMGN